MVKKIIIIITSLIFAIIIAQIMAEGESVENERAQHFVLTM